MTVGGASLGRHNGLVVFVDYGAPGDLLEVEIIESKKNLAFGKILKVLEAGAGRTHPRCQHFGTCGGCSWQHLSHEEQLRQKESILHDSLKELRKITQFEIHPIQPSPREYYYRNRVQVTGTSTKPAFRKRHSQDLVPIDECWIVEEPLKVALESPSKPFSSNVRYDLRLSPEGKVLVTPLQDEIELVGFSQVNRFQNSDLIQTALNLLMADSKSDLYELYAGSGNFTFPFLNEKSFRHLWAVEANSVLVKRALQEIQTKNISSRKLSFHVGLVEDFLRTSWPRSHDVVFLDPPRVGAEESVIKTLAQAKPRQILYLSCHPVTLARDLIRLFNFAPGYRIDHLQPFEMFPQTDHVETLVALSRV